MTRARLSTMLLVGLVPVLAVALVLQRGHDRSRTPQPRQQASAPPDLRPMSYAKAVAANYKVLSPPQSRRLLTYAQNLYACLHNHGVAVGAPRASRTRIELALPKEAQRGEVLNQGVACGDALGGPPPGASQVLRPAAHAILIFLPRYCLLDPKVARGAASS
jgi:hypothetical protein